MLARLVRSEASLAFEAGLLALPKEVRMARQVGADLCEPGYIKKGK